MTDAQKYSGITLILLFLFNTAIARSLPDTLYIKKDESIIFNDSIITFDRDTTLIYPEGIVIVRPGKKYLETKNFYDTIQSRAQRRQWTRQLYHLLFIPNRNIKRHPYKDEQSVTEYRKYQGKRIRSIRFYQLDPFGPVIKDTLLLPGSGFSRFLNKVHLTTHTRTIRNNLFFSEGDSINPGLMADNERILRQLPFIRDAQFILVPVGNNQVDILVVTRDMFSTGAEYKYQNLQAGDISLFDNNFLGMGHKFSTHLLYDFKQPQSIGGAGRYLINNIGGSFIRGNFNILSAFGTKMIGASFQRSFLNPYMKNAGGMATLITYTHDKLNGDSVEVPLKYSSYDLWYGRSFLLEKSSRRRIVVSGRYLLNNIMERPVLEEHEYYQYQRHQLFLGEISYSNDQYFKTGLIYNYGTTEDIPEGILASVTGGYELNEYKNRYYVGASLSIGKYYKRFGYLNLGTNIGGFLPKDVINQGVINFRTKYFSPLFPIGRFFYRQFVDVNFTSGINRYSNERITINDQYGIRGIRSDSLTGIRRLAVKTETVAFSPFYLYGFRFTFFAFADLGVIDFGDILFTKNRLYSGIGLGIRLHNSNLVFNTLQIRLAYYPVLPKETYYQTIVLSGEKLFSPYNFIPHKPARIEFR